MFRQFQKVVFVDNKDLIRHPDVNYPNINEVVTIMDGTINPISKQIFYFLKEYPKSKVNNINGIHESCFRELDDSWVDDLLLKITKDIEKEEVINII